MTGTGDPVLAALLHLIEEHGWAVRHVGAPMSAEGSVSMRATSGRS
jgi:hypothetical protein